MAIWATNVSQWFITFWATVKIGAVLVTVNTAYKIHEAEYLLRQSDTHTLVMVDGFKDSDYVSIIKELCPELADVKPGEQLHAKKLPFLRNVITVESKQPGCLTWKEALAMAEKTPVEVVYQRAAMINRHDVCNMQYTSGTTGFPQGGHAHPLQCGQQRQGHWRLHGSVHRRPDDDSGAHVPLLRHGSGHDCIGDARDYHVSHSRLLSQKGTGLHQPGTDYLFPRRAHHVHCHAGARGLSKTDFSHMRTGIMAGSPCPIKVMQEVVEKMHMPEICITYGQTEASPATTMSKTTDSLDIRVNTVGSAIFGVECKVVDPETGEDLPDNTDGEFVARGYNIMKGYYKMPAATRCRHRQRGMAPQRRHGPPPAQRLLQDYRTDQGHDYPRR